MAVLFNMWKCDFRISFKPSARPQELPVLGDYGKAARLFDRAVSILEPALGTNHPRVAEAYFYAAWALRMQGEFDAAEPLIRKAVDIRTAVSGADNIQTLWAVDDLGHLLVETDNLDEAERVFRQNHARLETAVGPEHPDFTRGLVGLALVEMGRDEYEQAKSPILRAIAIRVNTLGEQHAEVADAVLSLAIYSNLGEYAEADASYERAIGIYETALGENHPVLADALETYAQFQLDRSQVAEADVISARAAAIRVQRKTH